MSINTVAIVTISDTCFKNTSGDTSGPAIHDILNKIYPKVINLIIPDEKNIIEETLKKYCNEKFDLIITTGGTGLSIRDVTPEATKAVIEREIPGISIALTVASLKKTPMAMISRTVSGIRDKTLIINFPGSRNAVLECIEIVMPILDHAVDIIKNDTPKIKNIHSSMISNYVCPHKRISSSVDISKVALRPRESPFPMLEMVEAFKIIDSTMSQWMGSLEMVEIQNSIGFVMGESLLAKEPMPPFPASIKDGYACISSDGAGKRRVRAAVAAGEISDAPLRAGECVRINTGAPLPVGADCVVQVEDTRLISASKDNKTELEIEILVAPKPRQDVRPIGFDIGLGDLLVQTGSVINAAMVGLLAGAGYQQVKVKTRPKVAILSTGNELQDPSETVLKPAHIRDSNQTMLKALLMEHGYTSECMGVARDEADVLAASLAAAMKRADVLVCTGGVSMGERDLLKPVLLQDFGAQLYFGRVHMKPGKPSTFASCRFEGKTKYIFALPGNPVSAYVCCLLFVIRALRVCEGRRSEFPRIRVRLAEHFLLDSRPEYVRAVLRFIDSDLPTAHVLGNQCSSRLLSACGACVLLELPPASSVLNILSAGTIVTAVVTGRLEA
ncbi:gephyrin [Battus philenor]|uniref:gephyrin n=1 Tax=Battus philenor TaxID=42288 RepID=UPI0035D0F573